MLVSRALRARPPSPPADQFSDWVPGILRFTKRCDPHLRALEERITGAEEHRGILKRRLQTSTSEADLEITNEAYRRNTNDLLLMYREHKVKADSMLFTVLALFGGSAVTLAGTVVGHLKAEHDHQRLGERLEGKLLARLDDAVKASVETAVVTRLAHLPERYESMQASGLDGGSRRSETAEVARFSSEWQDIEPYAKPVMSVVCALFVMAATGT